MHLKAVRHLRRVDPLMDKLIGLVGSCRLEISADQSPFEALVSAVAHQQLTGRVAEVILGRFLALYPDGLFPSPAQVLDTSADKLRGVGFSEAKARSIHDIALKTMEGIVPSASEAHTLADAELIERLCSVRGVGCWTVEMFLIFTLGRLDVLPVDDFGVRKGFAMIEGLRELPKPRVLRTRGEIWAPYRSVAAWYLWRATELKPDQLRKPKRRTQTVVGVARTKKATKR